MKGKRRALAPVLALAAAALAAQEGALSSSAAVDWAARLLTVRIRLDVARAGLRLPAGRLEAERLVDQEFAGLAKEAVFSLEVDSYRRVLDTVEDGSLDVNGLVALASGATRESASFSRDMRYFDAEYSVPLGAIAALYPSGVEAVPLDAPLGYSPSRAYTGIVIYVDGELPVRGERVSARLRPCLFPRIYDEDMRPILERAKVDPQVLVSEGPVGYASGLFASAEDRVGDDPLRIRAQAIFGTARTDIVISRADAAKILARPENRDLVKRGRVLVVLDLSK